MPSFDTLARPSLTLPDDDEHTIEPDPAASVVAVGHTPTVAAPVPVPGRRPRPMPTDTARSWFVTGLITIVGALIRFWELGWRTDGDTPLFDEKYYAVQAAEMLRSGGVEDNQAYGVIVHPPLGKQLMAIGEAIFGYNPVGWRFASAVAGTVAILLIIRAVRRMTRSTMLGGIAGILLICDGLSQVMARTALLDSIIVVFVIAAFACLVVDRDQVRSRLASAVADGSMAAFGGRVPLGARWWRFGCGFLLGCATAVKWNGAYWIVAFGIMSVIWDVMARREYGARHPVGVVLRRDFIPSLWSLGIVPVLTYIASYWAWFLNETGFDRHVSDAGVGIVGAFKSLLTMTLGMVETSASITTPADPANWHPWESKPFAWPLTTRPVLYYLAGGDGNTGCGAGHTDCVQRILAVGTPMLWWVSLPVAGWALWKAIGRHDWRYTAVLVAYSAGYLPWFLIYDRQMYSFYMTPVAPFLVIGITLVLGEILGRASPKETTQTGQASEPEGTGEPKMLGEPEVPEAPAEPHTLAKSGIPGEPGEPGEPTIALTSPRRHRRPWWHDRRTVSLAIVSLYIGLVVANFVWMWPILVGDPITPQRLNWETWLPSWG